MFALGSYNNPFIIDYFIITWDNTIANPPLADFNSSFYKKITFYDM